MGRNVIRYGRGNSGGWALAILTVIGLVVQFSIKLYVRSGKPDRPKSAFHQIRLRPPRQIPTGPATKLPKERAVARFPALGVAGSPLNRAFLGLVERCRTERPEVFDDPEWPTVLAAEAVRGLP